MNPHDPTLPLRRALTGLRARVRGLLLLLGASRVAACAIVAAALLFLADYALRLPLGPRIAASLLLTAGVAYIAWRHLLRPLAAPLDDQRLAAHVERAFPEFKDRLASSLAFGTAAEDPENADSPEMMRAVIAETVRVAGAIRFASVTRTTTTLQTAAVAFLLLAGGAFAAATHKDLVSIFLQRNLLARDVSWPRRTTLEVAGMRPGEPRRVTRGRETRLEVHARGSSPDQVSFRYWETGDRPRVETMDLAPAADDPSLFVATLPVYADTEFTVEGGDDDRREVYRLEALSPPSVLEITMRCEYPAYLERPAEERKGGDQKLPQGTRLRLLVRANMDLLRTTIAVGAETPVDLERIEPRLFARDLTLDTDLRYSLRLVGANGQENDPGMDTYILRVLKDQAPMVRVQTPAPRSQRVPGGVVLVGFTARDDHRLTAVRLVYDLKEGRERTVALGESGGDGVSLAASARPPAEAVQGVALLDLARLRRDDGTPLARGDQLRLRIEATDSAGRTEAAPPLLVEMFSEEEIAREAQGWQQTLRESVDRARERAGDARLGSSTLREEMETGRAGPDEIRIGIGRAQAAQARVLDDLTSIASQVFRIFNLYVFNRIEDGAAVDQMLPFFERHLLEPMEGSAAPFRGSLYRGLWTASEEKVIRTGGSLAKLLEMCDRADRLAAEHAPRAYRSLGAALQAPDSAAAKAAVDDAGAAQEEVLRELDRLRRLMREWQNYDSVLRGFKSIRENQKQILDSAAEVEKADRR